MTKPNEQHQFDLHYVPHNILEGDIYKYILAGVDIPSRQNVTRTLKTMKESEFAFVLEAIHNKCGVFQCDIRSEFKSDKTKLLEKNNL